MLITWTTVRTLVHFLQAFTALLRKTGLFSNAGGQVYSATELMEEVTHFFETFTPPDKRPFNVTMGVLGLGIIIGWLVLILVLDFRALVVQCKLCYIVALIRRKRKKKKKCRSQGSPSVHKSCLTERSSDMTLQDVDPVGVPDHSSLAVSSVGEDSEIKKRPNTGQVVTTMTKSAEATKVLTDTRSSQSEQIRMPSSGPHTDVHDNVPPFDQAATPNDKPTTGKETQSPLPSPESNLTADKKQLTDDQCPAPRDSSPSLVDAAKQEFRIPGDLQYRQPNENKAVFPHHCPESREIEIHGQTGKIDEDVTQTSTLADGPLMHRNSTDTSESDSGNFTALNCVSPRETKNEDELSADIDAALSPPSSELSDGSRGKDMIETAAIQEANKTTSLPHRPDTCRSLIDQETTALYKGEKCETEAGLHSVILDSEDLDEASLPHDNHAIVYDERKAPPKERKSVESEPKFKPTTNKALLAKIRKVAPKEGKGSKRSMSKKSTERAFGAYFDASMPDPWNLKY